MEKLKKLFGGVDLTWKKLILFAIASGIITAIFAILPQLKYTSFNAITTTMEVWIFIGIFIIMNSKSNMDSALKCFVFFLISQPLVYLLQVPFSYLGWELFQYYKYWFIWTVLCLPMGYIGYYMKKDTWWGYLILFPMILLTAIGYRTYLYYFTFYCPKYILISLFCIGAMILYPNVIFNNKKIKIVGSIISILLIVGITILVLLNPCVYSTEIMANVDGNPITKDYKVSLKDSKYGTVSIQYIDSIDLYLVHADFKKNGDTELIVETPEGKIKEYNLHIEMDTYTLEEK
ncbi:MAG: hypothetical protein HUJ53_03585 [Holdemanella sp.]|nr:hypothetical protein [Holdemanella sp.]